MRGNWTKTSIQKGKLYKQTFEYSTGHDYTGASSKLKSYQFMFRGEEAFPKPFVFVLSKRGKLPVAAPRLVTV